MKFLRKSQAAMEFLMTYGWAILVVLVAIGALAYFGVLSPDRFLPTKCVLPAGVGCVDHKATDNGAASLDTIEFVLQNGMGFDATFVSVSVGNCGAATAAGDDRLNNGEREIFTATGCTTDLTTGGKMNEKFGVIYTNADTGLRHTINGSITTRIQ